MAKIAIIYHSGFGHTQKQAESILKGALSVENIKASLISVTEAIEKISTLKDFDAMLFGSPTYMGSVSAAFKAFMEKSTDVWFAQAWKDKLAGGFTNSLCLDGDKFNVLIQLLTFASQQGMLWLPLGISNESAANDKTTGAINAINRTGASLGLVAQSENDSPEVTPGIGDLKTAGLYGERFARAVLRWQRGAANNNDG